MSSIITEEKTKEIRFFVTWYGSIGGHKSTKSLSGKRLNWLVRSFYIRVPSLITPVHCITQTEEPEILTEILIEMMQNKRELFYEIVIEALEDIGLANAITEGLNGEFVPEEEVFAILNGEAEWKFNL